MLKKCCYECKELKKVFVSESARHRNGTILSEDYAEIVDEEGDYSTPASQYILLTLLSSKY